MIKLTKETVRENARQAYFDGRLQALHVVDSNQQCRYRDDAGRCCAIGASFDDEIARRFDVAAEDGSSERIANLVRQGHIETDDIVYLSALQRAHDGVTTSSTRVPRRKAYIAQLRELLDLPKMNIP